MPSGVPGEIEVNAEDVCGSGTEGCVGECGAGGVDAEYVRGISTDGCVGAFGAVGGGCLGTGGDGGGVYYLTFIFANVILY